MSESPALIPITLTGFIRALHIDARTFYVRHPKTNEETHCILEPIRDEYLLPQAKLLSNSLVVAEFTGRFDLDNPELFIVSKIELTDR